MPRKALDREMEKIKRDIMEMSELVRYAVSKAMTALEKNDRKLGEEVILGDELIDNYQTQIRRRSIQAIALQQPVAKDLRVIGISMDVAYNLERIGDYAKDIVEILEHMNGSYVIPEEIDRLGEMALKMVEDSADAFVNERKEKIEAVLMMEEEVDTIYESTFPLLKKTVKEDSEQCTSALNFALIAKFLERIADHSVNIVNRALYGIHGREEYL
ncbi:MAG: phosphate signaling complex protein PhoU [Candidatus Altiarchaeota archaeon]|nr:phosphate signaling complex protein PhoU [Candidatus Altiarchaeota archaeon]